MALTIVSYYGKQTSKCGYCKGTECSIAHGMHAYSLTPIDYQDLIDRGWRRSGHYCYKPNNNTTCCPCYAIRCDSKDFKLSKSHKKILKRMNRFLRDGVKDKTEELTATSTTTDQLQHSASDGGIRDEPKAPNIPIQNIDIEAVEKSSEKQLRSQDIAKELQIPSKNDQLAGDAMSLASSSSVASLAKGGFDKAKAPCKKAKQIRLERRQAKLAAKGLNTASTDRTIQMSPANQEKSIQDYIADASSSDRHKLKTKLIHVKSKQFFKTLDQSYGLYEKYQTTIHNDPPNDIKDYLDFLQRSPLKYTKTVDGPSTGYGSFHQQYWLDEKLIAVGVIDILPYCVSSVYFFYDPDYSFLSLGTYGSLREIEFVQQLHESVDSLKYYYMGFYIHSCPKMRYKGKLVPSYLLCPETNTWNLLTDETRSQLDLEKYRRLCNDPEMKDANEFLEHHLDLVLLLVERNTCITYREYIQSFNIETLDNMLDMIRSRIYKEITGEEDDRETISEYGKFVGKTCAHRMVYVKI